MLSPPLLLLLLITLIAEAKSLQLAVQGRPFHADERCGAGDVARKAANLDLEIFPLEALARFPQRRAHDRQRRAADADRALGVEDFRWQQVDLDAPHPVPWGQDQGPLDDVAQL